MILTSFIAVEQQPFIVGKQQLITYMQLIALESWPTITLVSSVTFVTILLSKPTFIVDIVGMPLPFVELVKD